MESEWETVKEEAVKDCLYLCPECHLLFSQAKCLTVHLKKAHQINTDNVDPYGISMEGSVLRLKRVWKNRLRLKYKCVSCATVFSSCSTLAKHVRIHPQQKVITCEKIWPDGLRLEKRQIELFLKKRPVLTTPLLCHVCGATFAKRESLADHTANHRKVKRHVCKICHYATTKSSFLIGHMQAMHPLTPRPRSHVCSECGKGFYNKSTLTQHVRYIHLKEQEYRCDLCFKLFWRPSSRNKHRKTHSGKHPYQCLQCGQSFTLAYNLRVHERIHTGEKPYQCQLCDSAFAQKNSLNVHMKKHQKAQEVL